MVWFRMSVKDKTKAANHKTEPMRRDIGQLTGKPYDLLVIGAGIYGACIAWDAALRGLSVALLEKADFGHATSANSLKTVHGGLRYLQHADFKRMRESIRERRALLHVAPHLVHPLPCLMPTYGHSLKGPEVMSIALLLNDLVSFDRNQLPDPGKHLPRGHIISREECLELMPGIAEEGLTGAALWYDAQMYNSERLTLSFVLSAAHRGAAVANYAEVVGFLRQGNRVVGVEARDTLTGGVFPVRARMVVNAAGPWVDQVLGMAAGASPLGVRLAKAINVATRPIFEKYAVGIAGRRQYSDNDPVLNRGSRLFFVVPWRDQSLIGTTYSEYEGEPDDFQVTEADVEALLDEVNDVYPPARLTPADVLFVYKGLVPIAGVHEQTGEVQRQKSYQIRDHREDGIEGLISVLGVKYTTARDVAEKVVDQIYTSWNQTPTASRSERVPVVGGDIEDFAGFVESVTRERPGALPVRCLQPLLYNYGTAYRGVLHYYQQRARPLRKERALLEAQVRYAVCHEMAQTLSDVIFRRTEVGTGGHPGAETLTFCAGVMADESGWDRDRVGQEIENASRLFAPARIPVIS